MKHASSRELFAHWRERRGARLAPERAEIDPGAIRRALGDIFLLGLHAEAGAALRLAGTRVCALFARELRGETFFALWDADDQPTVRDFLGIVTEEMTGVVAGAVAITNERLRADVELLLLPLRHRARGQLRAIGALAPLDPPFWLGSARVERLQLRSWRHLAHDAEPNQFPRFVPGSRPPAFVVYDGGRS